MNGGTDGLLVLGHAGVGRIGGTVVSSSSCARITPTTGSTGGRVEHRLARRDGRDARSSDRTGCDLRHHAGLEPPGKERKCDGADDNGEAGLHSSSPCVHPTDAATLPDEGAQLYALLPLHTRQAMSVDADQPAAGERRVDIQRLGVAGGRWPRGLRKDPRSAVARPVRIVRRESLNGPVPVGWSWTICVVTRSAYTLAIWSPNLIGSTFCGEPVHLRRTGRRRTASTAIRSTKRIRPRIRERMGNVASAGSACASEGRLTAVRKCRLGGRVAGRGRVLQAGTSSERPGECQNVMTGGREHRSCRACGVTGGLRGRKRQRFLKRGHSLTDPSNVRIFSTAAKSSATVGVAPLSSV
jgi:hypothetical protein